MALDIGTKRIGYAVSDESQTMAFPRGFFVRTNFKQLEKKLRVLAAEEQILKIIIGIPLDEDNKDTDFGLLIRSLGQKIARNLLISVQFVDEYGTTREALSKIPFRKDRYKKGEDDAVAAYLILMRYLQSNKRKFYLVAGAGFEPATSRL